jgi:protein involved in polysaccharide export with SLBB domain
MGPKRAQRLPAPWPALWLLSLALSMLVIAEPAFAQGRGGLGGGGLGDLLNQLGPGGRAGSALQNLLGIQGSPVDEARDRAAARTKQQTGGQSGQELATAAVFTPAERLLIQQFCTSDITEENERVLRLLDEFSLLERDNCRRANEPLFQFGYDAFAKLPSRDLISGTLPDDYRLGIGDEIAVTLTGQQYRSTALTIDRAGKLVLPGLQPIQAAGRTFGDLKREAEAKTALTLLGTEIYLSIATTRLLKVTVVGEVRLAGVHQVSSLSTVLDALANAGGIRKTGSLRRIQVQRGDKVSWLDLYDLVSLTAVMQDLQLQEGDRIIVPPIGQTVTIAGQVKRPGIYELPEGRRSISMSELMTLGGGPLRPRGNRYFHISFDASGRERVNERTDINATVGDGDLILVRSLENVQTGTVELVGHVRVTGRRSLAAAPTIRTLLQDAVSLKDGAYLPFAVLETAEPGSEARRFFPVDLQRVFEGKQDYQLRDRDRLIVLGTEDVAYLNTFDVQNLISPAVQRTLLDRQARRDKQDQLEQRRTARDRQAASGLIAGQAASQVIAGQSGETPRASLIESFIRQNVPAIRQPSGAAPVQPQRAALLTQPQPERELLPEERPCGGLKALSTLVSNDDTARFYNAARTVFSDQDLSMLSQAVCPKIFNDVPQLLPFALEHVVAVNGEVRRPGPYPATAETPLVSLIAVAGGVTREVDMTAVEITRFGTDPYKGGDQLRRVVMDFAKQDLRVAVLGPGDAVRFNPVFTDRDAGPVLLSGQFLRPGLYNIRRGEKLSELIVRAGGLTDQAYPYGAVFTRERVKKEQQIGFDRAARELNSALAVAAANRGVDPRAVLSLQELSEQLRQVEAQGRVVIEADPAVLQVRAELDTVLEAGDRFFMPKRPNFVSVIGDVLNPGTLQFIAGAPPERYLRQAGGFQKSADEGRVFVVFPNGAAQPVKLGPWNYTQVQIPPGSIMVVPKDPVPLDFLNLTKEVTGLLSNFGVAAASLAVISR